MKMKLLTFLIAFVCITLTGCDDDNIRVNREIEEAFRARYPHASRVEWECQRGYYVADFYQNKIETQAWFTPQAVWHMTETDVRYADLPQAVRSAFEQSEYAGWRINDIDMLEYYDRDTVYIIEVEQGNVEYDLYFSQDGVLVKVTPYGDGTDNGTGNESSDNGTSPREPSTILPAVKEWIAQHYPQARIIDIDIEHNTIEVDIVDDLTPREVIFSSDGEWLRTVTEVRQADVPAVVLDALKTSQYGSWQIDDIDHYITPTAEYYLFELESGNHEIKLKIDANGNLL